MFGVKNRFKQIVMQACHVNFNVSEQENRFSEGNTEKTRYS